MITIEANTGEMAARVRQMASTLEDTATPNRQIAVQLYGWVIKNFKAEGANGGMPWAPLKPQTASKRVTKAGDRRGFHPILIVTGHLRDSFTPFSDATQAGVGAQASAGVDYAAVHQAGSAARNIPARPMLPPVDDALKMAVQIYGLRIKAARTEADL